MADSDPWDDTDHHEIPRSTRRGSLRVSHLGKRSKIGDHAVEKKVNDLTSSLRATSEVLSTADRMLDHYRCMNDDQDDEIRRLRSELDRSTEFMHQRRNQKQNHPRSQVRFADQSSPEPEDDLHVSLRDLESEQRKLTKEISKDRDERERIDTDNRRTVRRLEESFQRVEDDVRESRPERERVRKGRGDESDAISRRQAEALSKKEVDAERDILSESVKLAVEKEREIRELRDQLRESRGASQDQEIESKVRRIYDQERSASKEKKDVGKLIEQLKSVKDLMSETASEKKMKEQLKRIKIEEDEIERPDRERRLLKRLQTLDEKLEDAEQERRKLEQALEATAKRLEWSEGGRSTLLKQIDDLSKELKNSDEEKTFISSSLRDCKAKLEESGLLRERLTSRMNSLCKKYENEEDERETLLKQIESLNEKLRDKNRELAEKTKFGNEQESIAKETETKREELKNRALETIKDYKIKCKKNEKEIERYKKDSEDVKEELRMFRRRADEESTRFLSLEREIKEVTHNRDQLKDELEERSKETDADIKNSKKRLNSALDENLNLEEPKFPTSEHRAPSKNSTKLASFKEENKHLTQRNQILERKFEEETSRLNQELTGLKEGIRDILGKKSRLEARLKEEQALREEFASSLDEAKEDQAKAKEEVASLYRQLQRERDECNLLVKDAKDDGRKFQEQSTEEGQKRLQKQKDEFDETTAEMKLQLADERATVKALRKQQEKDGQEIENMRSQLNRVTEERSHLKEKHDEVQREAKTKAEMREQDKTRISELETEVRRCHRSLNRATDEQKDGFQRVNETLDGLIEKFCEENSLSRPSTLSNRSFIEPQNWASETTEKLKWLEDEMIGRLHSEHGYKDQLNSYQGKVKNAFKKADTEKANLASELDKQSAVLKELVREKKDLEDKDLENQDTITTLQKKVDKLTKYLNSSIKALQASVSAVEDKQRVVDILDNLRGDQEDLDRIRNKYVRSQEQVGLLKRELSDAKTKAEEEKQDTKDVSHISAKLLESLNRLSSPRLAGKRGTKTSFSSRSKPKEEFGFIDFSSSSTEGVTPLKEDHNFKTPDRVSVRDLKRHSRPTRTQARNSSHAAPEKD